jgi:multidrug efflux pump subunit AcrB
VFLGVPLGKAIQPIERALQKAGNPPRGVSVHLRGEAPGLEETLRGLRIGLLIAIVIIFLLLAANFQSFHLSLAVILTTPAVLCGVLLMLLITRTTLNVQSFIGAIMAIGIAIANSILLLSFAERSRLEGQRASLEAAHEGATSRLRAILMTASAMICGMLPMALGVSEGGSQTAPLARAVIGGLLLSTFATLTFLPAIYSVLQQRASMHSPSLNPDDPSSRYYEKPPQS